MSPLHHVKALTFDLFGTILDLGGSLTPFIDRFLAQRSAAGSGAAIWQQWRARQRIEQYQDNIMLLGHSGYLETVRRALVYVLKCNDLPTDQEAQKELMAAWPHLSPFSEVAAALPRLKQRYQLVVLSNGEADFLDHLVKNRVQWDFDQVISVGQVGAFKPHPAVYRHAAAQLELEVGQCLMVSANAFDVVGARACGLRGIYVNRYKLPYDDRPFPPDIIVDDFTQLTDALTEDSP